MTTCFRLHSRRGLPALAVIICLSSGIAWAQDSVEALSLPQALQLTMQHNPQLKIASWAAKGHLAEARQATRWENPELEFEVEEFGLQRPWGSESNFTVAITQSIPLGSRRTAARKASLAASRVEELSGEVTAARVLATLHSAFYEAVAARERLDAQREADEIAQQTYQAVQARIEAGDIPPAELQRANTELVRSSLAVSQAEARYQQAMSGLAAFWGRPTEKVTGVAGTLAVPKSSLPQSPGPGGPHKQLVQAQDALAVTTERAAQAAGIPDLTVGLGYQGLAGFQESALVVLFSVPIPAFDRNQDAVDAARARRRSLQFAATQTTNELHARLQRSQARMQAALQQYNAVVTQLLPSVTSTYDKVQDGYRAGRFGTLDLLDARHQLVEARFSAIEAALEYNLAHVQVAFFSGDMQLLRGGPDNE